MVSEMYLAIFIFLLLIALMSVTIKINIKSVDNTIKIDARIGFIRFVIPHQRLIGDMIKDIKLKSKEDISGDLKRLLRSSKKIKNIMKHSSLDMFYMARFTKDDFYLNPFFNGIYLIVANQIKSYLYNNFKLVDVSKIKLIKDELYENVNYFICLRTNFISLLTAILKGTK